MNIAIVGATGLVGSTFIKILEEEKIAGAGLDVYDIEPLPENHKLRFLPNAYLKNQGGTS